MCRGEGDGFARAGVNTTAAPLRLLWGWQGGNPWLSLTPHLPFPLLPVCRLFFAQLEQDERAEEKRTIVRLEEQAKEEERARVEAEARAEKVWSCVIRTLVNLELGISLLLLAVLEHGPVVPTDQPTHTHKHTHTLSLSLSLSRPLSCPWQERMRRAVERQLAGSGPHPDSGDGGSSSGRGRRHGGGRGRGGGRSHRR